MATVAHMADRSSDRRLIIATTLYVLRMRMSLGEFSLGFELLIGKGEPITNGVRAPARMDAGVFLCTQKNGVLADDYSTIRVQRTFGYIAHTRFSTPHLHVVEQADRLKNQSHG